MVVMSVGGLKFCDQHNGHKWFLLPFIANFKGTPSPKTQIAFKKKAPNQIFSFYQNQKHTPAYFQQYQSQQIGIFFTPGSALRHCAGFTCALRKSGTYMHSLYVSPGLCLRTTHVSPKIKCGVHKHSPRLTCELLTNKRPGPHCIACIGGVRK